MSRRLAFALVAIVACSSSEASNEADSAVVADTTTNDVSNEVAPDVGSDSVVDATDTTDADAIDPAAIAQAHERADAALNALLLHYWSESNGYVVEVPGGSKDAGYWIFAQAFDALLDGVERHGGAHYAGLVETFYRSQNGKGWSRSYYDDETWMTLALLRAYDLTKDGKYLARAKSLFADVVAQWDTTCCGASHGGVWWDLAHSQKATASNMGPVIAALRLGARTGDASYLPWAQNVFDFWAKTMIDPTTHQVADHVDAKTGMILNWKFTYNEALTIGAAIELAAATKTSAPLAIARDVASFVRDHETKAGVLFDGDVTKCTGDCGAFKGIAMRYLSLLAATDSTFDRSVIDASAASIWSTDRTTETLFGVDWTSAPGAALPIEGDASATMALAAHAKLLGAAPIDPTASTLLQAEEATIQNVGLEAAHAGFEGWGYVAGWNGAGSVTFGYDASTASSATMELRYAAGAGTAQRDVLVDGAIVSAAHAFAATSSWDAYATTTISASFSVGKHTIAIAWGSGSANFLNLDRLAIK